ncbi:MAG: protein tyrosine phosphatase family protein [Paracoccaceae bacterium]|nr:protein tyrosine phosphatase family protein [Paracoccaceae bacterium]
MLDLRQISPDYAVAPQIDPEDFPAIKAAGFTTVINNRPDSEIPPTHHGETMRKAAEAAGLRYHAIPVAGREMTMETVAAQADALAAADGPVLAYCASGTRSSIVWSLGQAGRMAPEAILQAAAQAGYQLAHLRPTLEALAAGQR